MQLKRNLFFAYGVACHALFLGVYAWMAAFVGNLGFGLIPTIDGPRTTPLWTALAVNFALIAAFGVQHSVMARPAFKRWWTRFVPQPIERSTYVLFSCVALALLMWQWQPMGGVVWDVNHPVGRASLHALFAFGWLMVPLVSLLINHFDLFGTRQVWLHLHGRDYEHLPFRTPLVYRYVRHPLYVGWMIAFWATPTMTVAHLAFAALMAAYILIAIPLEERDLLSHFGEKYAQYRRTVGGLIPRWRGRSPAALADVDSSVFRDLTWWSWLIMIALLAMRFALHMPQAIHAGIAMCLILALTDVLTRHEAQRCSMRVQIRLGYAMLLAIGLLPGMGWLHAVQIAGTSARVLTGYCMLERELRLLPWNYPRRLTLAAAWEILTARPGAGGLLRFGHAPKPC